MCEQKSPKHNTAPKQKHPISEDHVAEARIWSSFEPRKEKPAIALTFDDGPHPLYTPVVLNVLKEKEVNATFFVTGEHAEQYPEIVQRMYAEGHDVGSHSYHHQRLTLLPLQEIQQEIERAHCVLANIIGFEPKIFRPPYGNYNADVLRVAKQFKYDVILWDIESADWERPGADQIVARTVEQVRDGAVILLHDARGDRSQSVSALPDIIDIVRNERYIFEKVSVFLAGKG